MLKDSCVVSLDAERVLEVKIDDCRELEAQLGAALEPTERDVLDLYCIPGAASLAVHGAARGGRRRVSAHRVVSEDGKVEPAGVPTLNPHGRVPTAMVDGELVMYESAASRHVPL